MTVEHAMTLHDNGRVTDPEGRYIGLVRMEPHPVTGKHYYSCAVVAEEPCSSQRSVLITDDPGHDSPMAAASALLNHFVAEHVQAASR